MVRVVGNVALVAGLLIAAIGFLFDVTNAKGSLLAWLLVVTGVGLRLEAAITARGAGEHHE